MTGSTAKGAFPWCIDARHLVSEFLLTETDRDRTVR